MKKSGINSDALVFGLNKPVNMQPFNEMGKAWRKAGLAWKIGDLRRQAMLRYHMEMSPMQLEVNVWHYRQKSGSAYMCSVSSL